MTRKNTRRHSLLALATLLAAVLVPSVARAIGLGPVHSRSRIGEYFTATVPVLGARPSDLRGLRVRLASRKRFAALGLEKSSVLYDLTFRVVPVPHRRDRGLIVIRSLRPVRAPFLSFVLHVRWPSGVLLRSYTVLLRPPLTLARPAPAPARPPVPVTVTRAPARPAPSVSAPAPSVAPSALPPLRHVVGPVRPGETLWALARRLRPARVSTDQMMVALYRANPGAFIGNINLLRAGYVLRVPDARAIAAVGRRQAVGFVLREDRLWARARAVAPRRPLELLTPTVVGPRTAAAVQAGRLRARLAAVEKRLARTRAALARARKTVAALRKRLLVVHSSTAAALARKPAPVRPAPARVPPRPSAPSFPWVPVLLGVFVVLLVVALVLRRKGGGGRSRGRGRARGNDFGFASPPPEPASAETVLAEGAATAEPSPAVTETAAKAGTTPPGGAGSPPLRGEAPSPRVSLLAEVDFSLAYGLQDQAIQSLEAYLAQNPGDEEVHAKLVEVYATARDSEAFLAAAAAHRASFGPDAHAADIARWAESLGVSQRLAASAATPAETSAAEVGTVFDEILTPPPVGETGTASLDDSALVPREATIGTATETALEFDIDLTAFETPEPAAAEPAAGAAGTPGSGTSEDMQSRFEESLRALRETGTATGSFTGTGEFAAGGATATDAVATKLSLVRAYLDMGDRDGARGLLDEVLREGTPEQQEEARKLSERLRD